MSQGRFDLRGRVAVVTGGYGVLGGSLADALASEGARVAILGRNREAAERKAESLRRAGGEAIVLVASALDEGELRKARETLVAAWGGVDILVNAAGGNVTRARTDRVPPFALPFDAFDEVLRLNLHGTVYPTLVFGEAMAERQKGSVVNISSMAAQRPLKGTAGYSAAKAGVDSFTRWLAVELARHCGPGLRVNALAPGFFVTTQNRAVLVQEDGSPTDRGRAILARTPMGRFGDPAELQGALVWLCSDAASFVTGVVIPIDGGFSADGGI
ncbi:MAG TPA: SDR family oxidoreductase [Vicinamibacteria bacterium]|nr:SDR family oxidoreductase [Vicinamibacteria bacterium]